MQIGALNMIKDLLVKYGYELSLALVWIVSTVVVYVRGKVAKKNSTIKAEAEANAKAVEKANAIEIAKHAINQFIKDAEQMQNYKGAERKAYVMTRAIQLAGNLLTNDEIDCYIEEVVSLSKQVNCKK